MTPKFWVLSMMFYFLLFWYGRVHIALPFFRMFTTINVYNERFISVYWGLFLVISYIGLCTCILSEYIANAVNALSTSFDEDTTTPGEDRADKACSN